MADKKKIHTESTPGAPEVPVKLRKTIKEDKSEKKIDKDLSLKSPDPKTETPSDENFPQVTPEHVAEPKGDTEQIIDSPKTDDAVADIVRKEGDELLDNYDQGAPAKMPKSKKSWWKRKWFVWTIILVILATVATLMTIPQTRYAILNKLGVRVGASLTVVDKTTGQPLKNVIVELAGSSTKTDQNGLASFEGLKQGPQSLKITRVAFSTIDKTVTLGWGSNPLGTYDITPSGAQYTFIITDLLADKPIEGAEVTSGQAVAKSDKDGKAVLTIDQTVEAEVQVTISASNYRSEQFNLATNTTGETKKQLVPSQKAVFVGNADGKYNLYSMYIDGQDRKTILEGTGNESNDIALAVSGGGNMAALVSTRESIKNEDGSLLETLSLVDVDSGETQSLERAADVRLIDWIGSVLIYQITSPGVGAKNDSRQKLISYNVSNDKRVELASANIFNSVASAQGAVYYATGNDQYLTVNPDGNGKATAVNANVQHTFRTAYNTLSLQTANSWYTLDLSSDTASQSGAPISTQNNIYVTDSNGQRSLWVNGTILNIYNIGDNTNNELHSQGNLSYPVRWLSSEVAVFRDGGADYVVSAQGGDARKVSDVVNTSGVIQTY